MGTNYTFFASSDINVNKLLIMDPVRPEKIYTQEAPKWK